MKRLVNLDYLRGICAFGIMIFHYTGWGSEDVGSFMGRVESMDCQFSTYLADLLSIMYITKK